MRDIGFGNLEDGVKCEYCGEPVYYGQHFCSQGFVARIISLEQENKQMAKKIEELEKEDDKKIEELKITRWLTKRVYWDCTFYCKNFIRCYEGTCAHHGTDECNWEWNGKKLEGE